MPCHDAQAAEERDRAVSELPGVKKKLSQVEAMLCGITKAMGFDRVVSLVDWEEVGVTPEQYRAWWIAHQVRDAAKG